MQADHTMARKTGKITGGPIFDEINREAPG
jgi:hypothetical protein